MFHEAIVQRFLERRVLVEQQKDVGHLSGYEIALTWRGVYQSAFPQVAESLEDRVAGHSITSAQLVDGRKRISFQKLPHGDGLSKTVCQLRHLACLLSECIVSHGVSKFASTEGILC